MYKALQSSFLFYLKIRMEVHFSGIPPPVITWYRDSFEIQPSRDFQISTTEYSSSLHIPEVFAEDAGLFTVKAYNKFGLVQCKAKLTVEGEFLLKVWIYSNCCLQRCISVLLNQSTGCFICLHEDDYI